jgi:murein DD-endopeptidase MepM/ murein hydrolase activator NlpD
MSLLVFLNLVAMSDAGPPLGDAGSVPKPKVAARMITERVGKRTFGELLDDLGVASAEGYRLISATRRMKGRDKGIDYRRLRPKDLVTMRLESGRVSFIEVRREYATETPSVKRAVAQDNGYEIRQVDFAVDIKLALVRGSIQSTLSESVDELGEYPVLLNKYVELFGWAMDFYRETRRGDEFTVLVEKLYLDGVFVGYGRLLSGVYKSGLHGEMVAFRADLKKGGYAVYDASGRSMQRAFLRNPVPITRITSSYGMRFHPVLGRRKKHNGVDYGAATGTKVWSVARGRVKYAAWAGASGKLVIVSHANGYETIYAHLSRINVRKNQYVAQRQLLGRVGTTGRSTGPHLHYGMKRHGRYVDPLRQRFARGAALPKTKKAGFLARVKKELPMLRGEQGLPEGAVDWLGDAL